MMIPIGKFYVLENLKGVISKNSTCQDLQRGDIKTRYLGLERYGGGWEGEITKKKFESLDSPGHAGVDKWK